MVQIFSQKRVQRLLQYVLRPRICQENVPEFGQRFLFQESNFSKDSLL